MKRKALSMVLASAMTLSMLAGCGGSGADTTTSTDTAESTESTETTDAAETTEESADAAAEETEAPTADVSSEGEHELSVYAWDKNFNIPALEAAEKAYQTVDPDFKLNIVEQSASSDVENAHSRGPTSSNHHVCPKAHLSGR